jgi:hypothetical protein
MSYWKSTTPAKWLTNEINHYIEKNKELNLDEFKKHIEFLIEHFLQFEKDYCVEFLNWHKDEHYAAFNATKNFETNKWTIHWESESDNDIEYTSEELFEKFLKRN